MPLIRVIHQLHYAKAEGRFKSIAFETSSDGGVSVFLSDCANEQSGNICEHIGRYYAAIAGDPPIYWEFSENVLPAGCHHETKVEAGKDPCHENIVGMNKKQSRNFFKQHTGTRLSLFTICDPDTGPRPLLAADLQ